VSSSTDRPASNKALLKAIARAWCWREALIQGRFETVADLAQESGFTERYVREMIQIAFLAPDILAAIVAGRQPRRLELQALRGDMLPLSWAAQRERLGVDGYRSFNAQGGDV
jgi:hypothetical protein